MTTVERVTEPTFSIHDTTSFMQRLSVASPQLGLRVSERRIALAVIDILLVNGALLATTMLSTDLIQSAGDALAYAKWFLVLTAVWSVSAVFFDCYDLARAANTRASVRSTALAVAATVLVYTFIPYVTPPLISRGLIVLFGILAAGSVMVWRATYARLFVQLRFQQRALVVGASHSGRALVAALQTAPANDANPFGSTAYQVVGFIDDDMAIQGQSVDDIPVLGDHRVLVGLAQTLKVDEIILAITNTHSISNEMFAALLRCREKGLRVVAMPTVYERLTGRVPIEYVGRDLHLTLPEHDHAGERAYRTLKRAIDLLSAVVGLAIMMVAMIPIALVNAWTSPGPIFYKQRRVGQGGRVYEMYKFRSMRPDAERETGAVWARNGDDRITPAGRFIRKTRIDELPQFINVLRGEMSLIGPRPERPEFVRELVQTPYYRARHAVKPGITGWAQIHYGYGNTPQDAQIKLEYDLYYVKHASLFLDLEIVVQTIPVMLLGKGT